MGVGVVEVVIEELSFLYSKYHLISPNGRLGTGLWG